MPSSQSDIATAERLGRRRARLWPVLGVMFVAQQAAYFSSERPGDLSRTVDHVKISAWVFLSLVLVALLWTGGFHLYRKSVRALLNDEVFYANRGAALSLGFVFAMLAAIALYILGMVEQVSLHEAIHTIVTAGVCAALVRFGMLERRAHRGG
jgi:hypothetical protein